MDDHVQHEPTRSAQDRLTAVFARDGAEPTATDTLRLAIGEHASLSTLIREYETIAAHTISIGLARRPRRSGLTSRPARPRSSPIRAADHGSRVAGRVR